MWKYKKKTDKIYFLIEKDKYPIIALDSDHIELKRLNKMIILSDFFLP